ncbi:MAG: GH1 family beta-glucosidase [Actinomycetes bacterium]
MTNSFPADFVWGAATSSYQIEGATDVDGRGVSIWDTFSKTPGRIVNGDTGDVGCDHYNRFPEDISIMKDLGIKSYRFSIAWPRLFPNGDDQREERGFDFYNRLIDALLAADIAPIITLYHWDLPQPLEDLGGWANRIVVDRFARYAQACAEAFGDRVSRWTTLNEPWCTAWLGYSFGVHAPGKKDYRLAIAASHHTALAHAEGVRAIKAVLPNASVGLTVNMTNYRNQNQEDIEVEALKGLVDANLNRWWIDACLSGQYPQNLVHHYGEDLQRVLYPGDAELLRCETDFLGINYYSDSFLGTPKPDSKTFLEEGFLPFPYRADGTPPSEYANSLTAMGWVVTPEGLGDLMMRVHQDWPEIKEILVTENGAAYKDEIDASGEIEDLDRARYFEDHLKSLQGAVASGAPVKGYFAWSLLDNFEWAEGYEKRFGLVYIDRTSLDRKIKRSGKVYAQVIRSNKVG